MIRARGKLRERWAFLVGINIPRYSGDKEIRAAETVAESEVDRARNYQRCGGGRRVIKKRIGGGE